MAINPLNWLLGLFSLDIGIDLGTANTLVHVRGKGIVLNEPSWVVIEKRTKRPLFIGAEAKEMIGRTPANIVALRPLRNGVISDFDITEAMLEYFIGKAHEQSVAPVPRPRVVIGIPSGATEVEKRAVFDATMAAGARETYLIEEPTAAALGADLPIGKIGGSMIVDIGGGTTEVAVYSLGGIVVSRSLRVAGDEMDQDIITYIRNKYNLLIGERMAERAKRSKHLTPGTLKRELAAALEAGVKLPRIVPVHRNLAAEAEILKELAAVESSLGVELEPGYEDMVVA